MLILDRKEATIEGTTANMSCGPDAPGVLQGGRETVGSKLIVLPVSQ